MRVTLKLFVALTIATVIILGIHGMVRVRRELALFEADMRRDAVVTGRILGRAVRDAWQVGGEDAGLAIVRDAWLSRQHITVRWVWLDDEATLPAIARGLVDDARRGETVAGLANAQGEDVLVTLVPVEVPGGRLGAIELSEPMAEEERYVQETIREQLLSTGVLIATMAVASLVIGVLFIGRPTRALVGKARRIAQGDLEGRLEIHQRDELGELARELDAMCAQLAAARDRAAAATEARLTAVEQLRHADRLTTVGRLASGVAHELGTPLNVVSGRAQMIAGGEVEGDELRDSARTIHDQARRMTAIVRQLLDFARRRAPRSEPFELRRVADRTVALVDTIARTKGVALRVTDGDEVIARIDDGQIEQALLNIVVNAIHATPPGGEVTVAVDAVEAVPTVDHGGARGRWARVRIADTGAGMDEATIARLFEPFFTTKEVGEGTGLGLAVTYGIVQEAGGWIEVQSRPGRGSVFSVHLPLARPGEVAA